MGVSDSYLTNYINGTYECPGWKPTLLRLRGETATPHWKAHSSSQSNTPPPIQIWWVLFFSTGWWHKLRHKKISEKVTKTDKQSWFWIKCCPTFFRANPTEPSRQQFRSVEFQLSPLEKACDPSNRSSIEVLELLTEHAEKDSELLELATNAINQIKLNS